MNYYFKEIDSKTGGILSYRMLQDIPEFIFPTNNIMVKVDEKEFYHDLVDKERIQKSEIKKIDILEEEFIKDSANYEIGVFTPYQVYQLYYYYYARWIWQLIHYRGCSYKWLNINDYQFEREKASGKSSTDWRESITKNDYLQLYEHKKIELGKDIIKNGIYFPFVIGTDNTSNILPVLFGKHRIYSLQLNPNETKDKEFLFIQFPQGYDFFQTFESDLNANYQSNNIECVYFNNIYSYVIYKYTTNIEHLIFQEFLDFSDGLPKQLFQYREIIPSNIIFNNKEAFEEFITNPFNEENLQEIQQKWKKLD